MLHDSSLEHVAAINVTNPTSQRCDDSKRHQELQEEKLLLTLKHLSRLQHCRTPSTTAGL